ncbi:cytochrome c biogenesis protein CcsA [Paenibacillus sp. L3-i20]|uniref:cytochrome c biogenesis protein CcsA n=1 Tax=Paenibacillus sp. L3-i20 TaxID=2905833 RepID=UPI001EE0D398|nr:cytochrome c biogenesis protein CcsA [Paenibacillus sp. L3-i20]
MIAFFLYCLSFIFYMISYGGKRWRNNDTQTHTKRWSLVAFILAMAGFVTHITYFFTRWIGSNQVPTSNMYEFMAFMGLVIMLVFIIMTAIYRSWVLGLFTLPLTIIILAYASVFPKEVQPLIPALKSIWLGIHVTMAALGNAFFAIGFIAGLMYLLRVIDFKGTTPKARRMERWLELMVYFIIIIIGFIIAIFAFRGVGYEAEFLLEKVSVDAKGKISTTEENIVYHLPPIFKPYNSNDIEIGTYFGLRTALFETPSWMEGVNAARKWNTIVWSLLTGSLLYGLLRLMLRRPVGSVLHRVLRKLDPEQLDEISYRAIVIGFPVYTLGALIFAMIWANIAWGRFWGWDPKEVWALITWLFYSAYLHLRLSRSWQGMNAAWLSVIGFIVVMFTLIGVNLIIAGLHSYSGVS